MGSTIHCTFRLPGALRQQLAATAAAEDRTVTALVVALLDRGVVERAREQDLLRRMVEEFDAIEPRP